MDEKTLTALQGSIEKWRKIVFEGGDDEGINNCPLCQEFYDHKCRGCPVFDQTQKFGCAGSPYAKWEEFEYEGEGDDDEKSIDTIVAYGDVDRETATKAAIAEFEFLKSLLPKQGDNSIIVLGNEGKVSL